MSLVLWARVVNIGLGVIIITLTMKTVIIANL